MVVVILFVSALIGDGVRRNVSDDTPLASPQLNPHPVERVKLYVVAPSNLNVSLGVEYSVGMWASPRGGSAYCGPYSDTIFEGKAPLPARIMVPVPLKWDGSAYEGEFSVDHYFPGTCHWGFTGLDTLSPVKGFVFLEGVKYSFSVEGDAIHNRPATEGIDLWCGVDPSAMPGQHGEMICTSLHYFAGYPGVVASELLAKVSAEHHVHMDFPDVVPYMETVTLRYHDLAAENRAAMASH
ncbi:MAG TPA: hypothetical protein VFK21_12085 [Gammaproteobacteria bacterium]|nr:hypothetical protein [Gammaproteobacteria bacterium]